MSDDDEPQAYLGLDLSGDLVLTDDEVRALRSAARLTLNEAGSFIDLPRALQAIIIATDEIERLRDELRRDRKELVAYRTTSAEAAAERRVHALITEIKRLRAEVEQHQGVTDEGEDSER